MEHSQQPYIVPVSTLRPRTDFVTDKAAKSSSYKTEMCKKFLTTINGFCQYGDKCQFAHGAEELRNRDRPEKYQTKPCWNFTTTGNCRFGQNCSFQHNMEMLDPDIAKASGVLPTFGPAAKVDPNAPMQPNVVHVRPPAMMNAVNFLVPSMLKSHASTPPPSILSSANVAHYVAAAGGAAGGAQSHPPQLNSQSTPGPANLTMAQQNVKSAEIEYARSTADLAQRKISKVLAYTAVGKAQGELEAAREEQTARVSKIEELKTLLESTKTALTESQNAVHVGEERILAKQHALAAAETVASERSFEVDHVASMLLPAAERRREAASIALQHMSRGGGGGGVARVPPPPPPRPQARTSFPAPPPPQASQAAAAAAAAAASASNPAGSQARSSRWSNVADIGTAAADAGVGSTSAGLHVMHHEVLMHIPEDCAARFGGEGKSSFFAALEVKHAGVVINANEESAESKKDVAVRAILLRGQDKAQIDACKKSIENKVVDVEMQDAELSLLASSNDGATNTTSIGGNDGSVERKMSPSVQQQERPRSAGTISSAPVIFNGGGGSGGGVQNNTEAPLQASRAGSDKRWWASGSLSMMSGRTLAAGPN
eukprot:gene8458-4406_t